MHKQCNLDFVVTQERREDSVFWIERMIMENKRKWKKGKNSLSDMLSFQYHEKQHQNRNSQNTGFF